MDSLQDNNIATQLTCKARPKLLATAFFSNRIGEAGARELLTALKLNKTLVKLDLEGDLVPDALMADIAALLDLESEKSTPS